MPDLMPCAPDACVTLRRWLSAAPLILWAAISTGCAAGAATPSHGALPVLAPAQAPAQAPASAELESTTPARGPGLPPAGIRIFTGDGTPTTWDALVEAAAATRVVLLGEIHDDRVGHEARHALVEHLAGPACAPLVLSLEMLESDVQLVVDEYQAGLITRDHFMRASRPWPNHAEDYEPYLTEARRCGFPVVAANPPRRYVNRVAREGTAGLDGLDSRALALLPPLPLEPPTDRYRAAWNALMGGGSGGGAGGAGGHGSPHGASGARAEDPVLKAQNLWDAGMAWAVAQALEQHPEARVLHVAGAFHVQDYTGIPEHLARYAPEVRPLVVVAYPVEREAPFSPESHGGKGDFVILTYRR
jgi:uncharacterized iron-regulated protein